MNSMLKLDDLFHVPSITKNLISMSKFAKYRHVYFDQFHYSKWFLTTQVSNLVLLEGFLDESELYCFNNLSLKSSWNNLSHKSKALTSIIHNTIISNKTLDNVKANPLVVNKLSMGTLG